MSGPDYIPGVERFGSQSIGGAMDTPNLPARAVEHTVECPPGRGWFLSMASYLVNAGTEPQVIYDPLSDSLGQFGPLGKSARALRNAGSLRTNRTGAACIQIEVCGKASQPWTNGWNPYDKPNFLKLTAALDAWDIPREWPAGSPQAYPGDHDDRDQNTWLNHGGYFGHSQVPGNDHGDPGAIDTGKVPPRNVTAPEPPDPTDPSSFPGSQYFGPGKSNWYIQKLGEMLVNRGGGRFYQVGPSPSWGDADRRATQAFQLAQGWTGTDADGFPGPQTWALLTGHQGNDIPASTPVTPPVLPRVSLSGVIAAATNDPAAAQGHITDYASTIIVERALAREGFLASQYIDGSFGTKTRTAYGNWQGRLGYYGSAADGIPGETSLRKLGQKYGFTVVG
jgi:hypothetical protein